MISDALWRERFGASPGVLGESIRVSAAASGDTPTDYRIIGVLAQATSRFASVYLPRGCRRAASLGLIR
jgi:hypothetical protein